MSWTGGTRRRKDAKGSGSPERQSGETIGFRQSVNSAERDAPERSVTQPPCRAMLLNAASLRPACWAFNSNSVTINQQGRFTLGFYITHRRRNMPLKDWRGTRKRLYILKNVPGLAIRLTLKGRHNQFNLNTSFAKTTTRNSLNTSQLSSHFTQTYLLKEP